ncbi:HAD family phosphatase [Clostridium sp. JN-9]|uniref:HAD family hydrolase n=1 Tax=Clostridium sp. JN-9 TaxID=2507159 RepID=UPI000FFDFC52|nr:HAD family phosphatase [Clostridium sp. JN-9]QAT41467.1 HAD family phosphatase [Clostridium sp. JN-9]
MFDNIKGAIFDMDGTIIDSMWVWSRIDRDYLKKRGTEVPEDLYDNIGHLSFNETAEYFKDRFNISDSVENIQEEWNRMAFDEYSKNVKLKPGVKKFLNILKAKNIKISVASSNSLTLIEAALKSNDVYNLFDSITTTDEVKRNKNFPDVYLLAAKKLGLAPYECVVFEDILPAIIGAKASGAKVIGVHDFYSKNQMKDIIEKADSYIFEYNELLEMM